MLLEVLAALVITAAFVAVVLPFAGSLVQHWWKGEADVEVADGWMQAIARLSDDLEQAVPVSAAGDQKLLCFGASPTRVQFVRPSLGGGAATDLDVVTLTVRSTASGDALVRSSRPFGTDCLDGGPESGAASTVIEGAFRLRFASVGEDGQRLDVWRNRTALPIRLELSASAVARAYAPPAPIVLPIAARTKLAGSPPQSGAPP